MCVCAFVLWFVIKNDISIDCYESKWGKSEWYLHWHIHITHTVGRNVKKNSQMETTSHYNSIEMN